MRQNQKVFVHYPHPGKKPPMPPAGPTCTVSNQVSNNYLLAGWQMPNEGVSYKINLATAPLAIRTSVSQAINNAFAAWNAFDPAQIFNNAGLSDMRTAKLDGQNVIAWKGIDGSAIAITYVWYWTDTGLLAEVDTMFNKNLPWSISSYSIDCINSSSYDVQNIATHEFGHWVGLDDLYDNPDSELTMYGYGATGELKKDTLEAGDIEGVTAIAP